MKKQQIVELMRDIDPRFQEKADARAAAAKRRQYPSRMQAFLISGAAACCAGLSAIILLPNLLQKGMMQDVSDASGDQNVIMTSAQIHGLAPFDDLSDDRIRFVTPAYAPYALEISAEKQQMLANVLHDADWRQIGTDADDSLFSDDGTCVTMYVYDTQNPYFLTFNLMNCRVRLCRSSTGSDMIFTVSPEVMEAVSEAVQTEDADLEEHMTWCAEETLHSADFWKNFILNPRECDMTKQEDVFYKMSNSVDYFSRASGNITYFCKDMQSVDDYEEQIYKFQINLDIACGFESCERVIAANAGKKLKNLESGQSVEDDQKQESLFFETESEFYERDGSYSYHFYRGNLYDKTPDVLHRIDSQPIENAQRLNGEQRVPLCGMIGYICLENQEDVMGLLSDFPSWEIVGSETVNGRDCVHISGQPSDAANADGGETQVFELYTDTATGAIVKMVCYDGEGNIIRLINVENLAFDADAESVKRIDRTGYTEIDVTT